jgi:hypothetical protein
MLDDKNMIDEDLSVSLKRRLFNSLDLQNVFKTFTLQEEFCRSDVIQIIDTFSKIIIRNTLPEPNTEMGVDDLVNLADSYANINALLQNAFAAGLLYGRAKFDQDLKKQFPELTTMSFIKLVEQYLAKNDPEFPNIDISDFLSSDEEDDDEDTMGDLDGIF